MFKVYYRILVICYLIVSKGLSLAGMHSFLSRDSAIHRINYCPMLLAAV